MHPARWKGAAVAVKVIEHRSTPNGGMEEQLAREALLGASVLHPNLVSWLEDRQTICEVRLSIFTDRS
jgi:hypothetical protein